MMDDDTSGRLSHRSWNHSKGDGFEVKWRDRDFKSVDMIDQIGRNLFQLSRLHDIVHLGARRRETFWPDVLLKRFSTTFRLRDGFKSDHPFRIEIRQGRIHFHLCLGGLGQTNQNRCRQSYVSHVGHRSFYGSLPMTGVKIWLTFSESGSLILDCSVTEKNLLREGCTPFGSGNSLYHTPPAESSFRVVGARRADVQERPRRSGRSRGDARMLPWSV